MNKNNTFKMVLNVLIIMLFLFAPVRVYAQHRGDNLTFQGLAYKENLSTKASAMGGAMTAVTGDVSSLFYNPAGLARVDEFQISVNMSRQNMQWWENQNYYTDRQFTTLPLYLEGLYVPRRENHGRWDYELYKDSTNFFINPPQLGYDSYDKKAADWTKSLDEIGLKNVSAAYPFMLFERKFVVAAGFIRNGINNFDRNETYTSPVLSSYDYEDFKRVVNGIDTLSVKWSRFLRQRTGAMNNITAGLSNEVIPNVMIGVGVNIQFGQSDDLQSLTRFGDLNLIDAQKFRFYFVDSARVLSGTSKFKSFGINFGAMVQLNKLKVGVKVDLPYTLTRKWDYTEELKGSATTAQALSGTDEFKMPAIYNFGISFQPVDNFLIAFNYENAPYGSAEFTLASPDTMFRKWVDQNTLAFGIEYKMYNFLTVLAGYRTIPEIFIPDGAAIKDKGPAATSYNAGISVTTFLGRLDLAYEYRSLKYYDSYYSNANYAFESNSTIMLGFTYLF